VTGFLNEVNPIVCQLIPNGTETIESPFWFTLDPESHLVTSIYGQGCDVDPSDYMRWELLANDFIKTADVVQNPRGVLTLHEVTDGQPERSPIYVEVMVPHGMAQELLVALRSPTGENWGTTRLNRAPGDPMFSEHEISFMSAAAPVIAEGLRRGLLVGEAIEPEQPDAPGLVVMTPGGEVESLSPGAEEWFSRLPDDDGRKDGVPTSVLAAAAGALRDAERSGSGGVSTARVPMTDGRWAVVHGAVMEREYRLEGDSHHRARASQPHRAAADVDLRADRKGTGVDPAGPAGRLHDRAREGSWVVPAHCAAALQEHLREDRREQPRRARRQGVLRLLRHAHP